MFPFLIHEGTDVNKDNFGTNRRMTMHYSWLQHQKGGGECGPGAHRKQDTVGVREDDAGGGMQEGDLLEKWRIDGILRWCGRAVGSVLRIERYIYIFCVLPHLESTPLGRVEHQEAFEEVLAVC